MQAATALAFDDKLPDVELARRVAAGSHEAFTVLMRRYNQRLYRVARSVLKDDAEAEDAVQEAYLLAYRAIGRFRGDAKLSTWLVRIVVTRRLLESKIDELPDAFRVVFVLRALEELSVEETAAALAVPEATVRTRFFRARGLLREALSKEIDLAYGAAFAFAGARCDRIVANVMARLESLPASED